MNLIDFLAKNADKLLQDFMVEVAEAISGLNESDHPLIEAVRQTQRGTEPAEPWVPPGLVRGIARRFVTNRIEPCVDNLLPITMEELTEILVSSGVMADQEDPRIGEKFLYVVEDTIVHAHDGSIEKVIVADRQDGWWYCTPMEKEGRYSAGQEPLVLWSLDRFTLALAAVVPRTVGHRLFHPEMSEEVNACLCETAVACVLSGRATPSAFGLMAKRIEGVLSLLFDMWENAAHSLEDPEDPNRLEHYGVGSLALTDVAGEPLWHVQVIQLCLNAIMQRPQSKKQSFEKRIRNAIELLARSSEQVSSEIELALAVAAMEAMVGQNRSGITSGFVEMMATLLEPQPKYRASAVKFFKRLYDQRSRVFHGDTLSEHPVSPREARTAALGTLFAFCERLMFFRRMGIEPENPGKLLEELTEGKFVEGRPVGIAASPCVGLWRRDAVDG